jgi:hypothetical protein
VAVSIGALVPLLAPNFYGPVSTALMTQLPLVFVPTYLVPTFLILHFTALLQARRLGSKQRATGNPVLAERSESRKPLEAFKLA